MRTASFDIRKRKCAVELAEYPVLGLFQEKVARGSGVPHYVTTYAAFNLLGDIDMLCEPRRVQAIWSSELFLLVHISMRTKGAVASTWRIILEQSLVCG